MSQETDRYLAKVAAVMLFAFACGLYSGLMDWCWGAMMALVLAGLAWFFSAFKDD